MSAALATVLRNLAFREAIVSHYHHCPACGETQLSAEDMNVSAFPDHHNEAMRKHFGAPICDTCTDAYVETVQDGVMLRRLCEYEEGEWWPRHEDDPAWWGL